MKILFVIPCGSHTPSGAVRVLQYRKHIEEKNIRCSVLSYRSPFLHRWLLRERPQSGKRRGFTRYHVNFILNRHEVWERYRTSFMERLIVSLAPRYDAVFYQWVLPSPDVIGRLKKLGVPLIYDFDDAVYLKEPERWKATVESAWRVVAGNPFLADRAKEHNPRCVCVPGSVDLDTYGRKDESGVPDTPRERITVGWIGGSSNLGYLRLLEEPLRKLAAEGYPLELLIAGTDHYDESVPRFEGVKTAVIPTYCGTQIPSIAAKMDIGVMPLLDTEWERGKCAMKAIVYMAAGIPAVCSRVGEALNLIDDGVNGFLAGTPGEWEEKIRLLLDDPILRRDIGKKGRETVEGGYSTKRCFDILYEQVLSGIPVRN